MQKSLLVLASVLAIGTLAALSPDVALSQPAPGVSTTHHHATHRPTRSHRSEMRHRANMSKERARAGAEHMRTMHMQ